jgi:RNA polymerase sigma factor (sigma-70 family)
MHEPNSGFEAKAVSPEETDPTDAQLLAQFVSRRDQAAFEKLLRRHGPMVFGTCCRILRRHHEAEDAFQTTFLSLAQNAARIGRPEMLANWLFRVARHAAIKVKQAAAKRRQKEQQMAPIAQSNPAQAELWAELAPVLDDELARLSDKLRITVVLCDIEGKTRRQAARQLGCPEATVSSRLMKARALLARRLARQGIVLSTATIGGLLTQNAATAAVPGMLLSSTLTAASAVGAGHTTATGIALAKPLVALKGALGSVPLGKAALAIAVAGVTVAGITAAAVMFVASAPKKPAVQAAGLQLPPEVERALEENAKQLGSISMNCSLRLVSRLSPAETFQRLHLFGAAGPDPAFFEERPYRVIWQDQKLYLSQSFPSGELNGQKITTVSETTFDGRVFCSGTIREIPKQVIASVPKPAATPQGKGNVPVGIPRDYRFLSKEPVAKALQRDLACCINGASPYFNHFFGFVFSPEPHGISSGGEIVEQKLQVETTVLNRLRDGGKLISVEQTTLDSRPSLRIEVDAPNPVRRAAESVDLNQARETLSKMSQNASKMSPENSKIFRENLARQEQQLKLIEEHRKSPALRRYTFFLDPAMHYAVRRVEQRYGAEALLQRADCGQFDQVPGRQLWLPRRIETQMYEWHSLAGPPLKDSFLSQVQLVSAYNGSRVPDETFRLDYTAPGTMIRDGTDAANAKSKDGYISYTIPARLVDLPAVIERARNGENLFQVGGMPVAAEPLVERYRRGSLLTILLCNVAMFGAGAGYLAWRRRREGAA